MHARSSLAHRHLLIAAAGLVALAACTTDGGSTSESSTGVGTTAGASTADASTGDAGTSSSESSAAPTTGAPGSTTQEPDATTGDVTTGPAPTSEGSGETTAPAPTDGPGVLPGEGGLDAFCRRYIECGGTYYADQQTCIDASLNYWGACPTRQAALDEFGACMSEIDCADWSPDAYNPGSTPCAGQWDALGQSRACP